MIWRARAVVTMDGAPIENGGVMVEGKRIVAVGRFLELAAHHPGGPVTDLGEMVLFPGLINAHCHLDYTMMRKAIDEPKTFSGWISRINALKRSLHDDDYLAAILDGFTQLIRWGTTTVFNIESFPELLDRLPPPPIRTWWFRELIDIRQAVPDHAFEPPTRPDWLGGFGLSPHSPYTASVALYRRAGKTGMPITTHLAESAEESLMFRDASGELHDFLAKVGRPMDDCGHGSPVRHLIGNDLLPKGTLLVHMNEIEEEDFALLDGFHIVHCPRSHRYFRHTAFPFKRLHSQGVNLCVGTDSLASNDSLSLFAELQALHRTDPWLDAEELLKTVTLNPAAVLNLSGKLGCIRPGAFADLAAIPFASGMEDVYEAIVANRTPVPWLMIDGKPLP